MRQRRDETSAQWRSARVWIARRWKVAATTLAVAVGWMAGEGLATAQVIHACVRQNNGTVRIVADGVACAGNEDPLSWNAAGPAGPPGPQGPPSITSTYVRLREAGPNPDHWGHAVATALCDPGDLALGGGGGGGSFGQEMRASRPSGPDGAIPAFNNPAGWTVVFNPFSHDAFAEVVCARVVHREITPPHFDPVKPRPEATP